MRTDGARLSNVLLLFVLNLPLLGELIRRYLLFSDMVFIVVDSVAIITLFIIFLRGTKFIDLPNFFWILFYLFLMWGMVSTLFTHFDPVLAGIGARSYLMPFIFMGVSAAYFSTNINAKNILYNTATIWVLIILVVAVMQLILGKQHPINIMPGSHDLESAIGDYTVSGKDLGLSYMFRPTSIFMHTGKFGQVLFTLVLYRWTTIIKRNEFNFITCFLMVLDLIAVIVSGQRSAFVFLLISSMLILFSVNKINIQLTKKSSVLFSAVIIIISTIVFVVPSDLGMLIFERLGSGFTLIPDRLDTNLFSGIGNLFSTYPVIGEGLGFFTLGSARFGGAVLYDFIPNASENAWFRIIAEVGVVGLFLFILLFSCIALYAYRTIKLHTENTGLFTFYWLLSIGCWSFTHDIFSNVLLTVIGFSFSGEIFSYREKS